MAAIPVLGGPPGPLLVKPDYSGGGGSQKWPKNTRDFAYKKGGFFEVGGTPGAPGAPILEGGAWYGSSVITECVLTCQCIRVS